MRTTILFALILATTTLFGQVADRTEVDCSGMERSIYEVGNAGKVLIIASKGLDCSICMNSAPAVGGFAEANMSQIEVWGAMSLLYTSQPATCAGVDGWVDSYGWDQVFAFRDVDEFWAGLGFPTYHVVHPSTHELLYEGPSWNTATTTALSVISSSVDAPSPIGEATIYGYNESLHIELLGAESGLYEMEVFNLVGQRVAAFQSQISEEMAKVTVPFDAHKGVYILRMAKGGRQMSYKFLIAD